MMAILVINSSKKRMFTYFEDISAKQQGYLPLIKKAPVNSFRKLYIC